MHKPIPAIEYHEFIDMIEQKHGWDVRDMGGKYKYQRKLVEEINEKYQDNTWYTTAPVNYTEPQKAAYNEYLEGIKNEPPYLDFWHWALDEFGEFNKGGFNYLCIDITKYDPEYPQYFPPEWVQPILKAMLDEVQGNEAYDEDEGTVTFFIDW